MVEKPRPDSIKGFVARATPSVRYSEITKGARHWGSIFLFSDTEEFALYVL